MNPASTAQKEARVLEARNEELRSEQAQVTASLAEARDALKEIEQQTKRERNVLALEQKRVAEYAADREKEAAELSTVHDELEAERLDLQTVRAELEAVSGVYKEKRQTLEKQLDDQLRSRRAELVATETTLEQSRAQLADVTGEVDQAKRAAERAERELATIDEQIAEARSALVRAEAEAASAESQHEKLEAALEKTEALHAERMKAYREAQEHEKGLLRDAEQERLTASEGIAKLRDDLKQLQEVLAATKREYESEKIKLFAIAERERGLAQREEYIRDRYKDAGVEFPPLS